MTMGTGWVYETDIHGEKHTVVKRPRRIMGAQSMLFHLPHGGMTIVILSNTDAASLDDFAAEIGKRGVGHAGPARARQTLGKFR